MKLQEWVSKNVNIGPMSVTLKGFHVIGSCRNCEHGTKSEHGPEGFVECNHWDSIMEDNEGCSYWDEKNEKSS